MTDRKCPDCGGAMKEGFLLDQGHGEAYATSWIEGPAERSFWWGVKIRGRTKYAVQSFRCDRCGLLKSFAQKPAS